jgi:protein-tyrosine phosphatase
MSPTPPRVLPLQGASNFRDLGGYAGHGGRPLRWRRLFRSDHLGGLTPQDKQLLGELGLARALDFRGAAERAAAAYELPGVTQHSLAIEPLVVQQMQALLDSGQTMDAHKMAALMQDLYRSLVNDEAHRYAALFEHLLEADTPLVFHCTAGKDRTGLAAAWILLALGVPRATVLQDYLLTNQVFQRPPRQPDDLPEELLAVLWQVQQGFLDAALHVVEQDHGGIEAYLRQRLGLSPAAHALLGERYLAGP